MDDAGTTPLGLIAMEAATAANDLIQCAKGEGRLSGSRTTSATSNPKKRHPCIHPVATIRADLNFVVEEASAEKNSSGPGASADAGGRQERHPPQAEDPEAALADAVSTERARGGSYGTISASGTWTTTTALTAASRRWMMRIKRTSDASSTWRRLPPG